MDEFHLDGQRLAYTVYGEGPRITVLLPRLLPSQKMQAPLARSLAARDARDAPARPRDARHTPPALAVPGPNRP